MRAIVSDIDGVLLQDNKALPGARAFVESLTSSQRDFLLLTNYPSQTPGDLRDRFLGAGLDVPAERFYTSAMATAEFLEAQAGSARRVYVVGEGALVHALYGAGFTLAEDEADYVVIGETRAYNFDMIQRAARLVKGGARLIATNPDVAGPAGRPSCGAFSAPVERITGRKPLFVGKPNPLMMRSALRRLKAHSEDAYMVGDNMDTDIIAGLQTGMETILVLSGVSQKEDLVRYAYRPDHVVAGAGDILPLVEAEEVGSRS